MVTSLPPTDNPHLPPTDNPHDGSATMLPLSLKPASAPKSPTLHYRLLQIILPAVLVPLAIVNSIGYLTFQRDAEKRVKQQIQEQVFLKSSEAASTLNIALQASGMVASNPAVISAVQDGNRRVIANGMDQLSTEQVKQRFETTKLIQPDQALNDYLKQAATNAGIIELLITEKTGFSVASNRPPAELLQRNQAWWQEGRDKKQWISDVKRNATTNTSEITISQAILDPDSGEFLGVVKVVLPFSSPAQPTADSSLAQMASQQVQLLDRNAGQVIATIASTDGGANQSIIGGDTIKTIAASVGTALQDQKKPEQIVKEIKTKYALQDVIVTPSGTLSGTSSNTPSGQTSAQNGSQSLMVSFTHEGKFYTLATLPQKDWMTIASVDRAAIAANSHLLLFFLSSFLVMGMAASGIILLLSRQISSALNDLTQLTEKAASGDLNVAASPAGTRETQALARNLNAMVAKTRAALQEQAIAVAEQRLLTELASFRTRHEHDPEQVFSQGLQEARKQLGVDRLVIYRFESSQNLKFDRQGYIAYESVASGLPLAQTDRIQDACIPPALIELYRKGRVVAVNDTSAAQLHPEHRKLLERLQVKAILVVPILHKTQIYGLMIAHHCTTTHQWQGSETHFMQQLAAQFGVVLDHLEFLKERETEVQQLQLLRDILFQITRAESSEEILAQLPVTPVRLALKADRVILYRFDENWKGTITAESVNEPFPRAIGAQIYDPCFARDYVEQYRGGRVKATPNIYEAGLTECHLSQLEPFQVKANLVAPIIRGDRLLGLFIAHQCSAPRHWKESEIEFMAHVAAQIGLALDRCDLLQQKDAAMKQAHHFAEEQRQQREMLQRQIIKLIDQVEGAAKGDLTVRADVTEGEIGTVADFFNAIVESMRQVVTQVKQSVLQVNDFLGENEIAVQQLAEDALKQAGKTASSLDLVEEITQSIQSVAESAHQAAAVTHLASITASEGEAAMAHTVTNILSLREAIGTTAKKVKRLGEASQQISKVISVINQFAMQTNLLAINAGIEAARAGEGGQGFAVIAEEIGDLAVRSAKATQEIEEIVDNILSGTNEVVEAMEQSTTQVVEGTQLVENTKHSLGQILDVSQQIDQLVQSISTATASQVQISQVIAELMRNIAQVSEQTSKSSRQVSGSLRQTVAIGQKLQVSVSTFTVNQS